jgi:hypothetical protein
MNIQEVVLSIFKDLADDPKRCEEIVGLIKESIDDDSKSSFDKVSLIMSMMSTHIVDVLDKSLDHCEPAPRPRSMTHIINDVMDTAIALMTPICAGKTDDIIELISIASRHPGTKAEILELVHRIVAERLDIDTKGS